jgi:hypothetical protein
MELVSEMGWCLVKDRIMNACDVVSTGTNFTLFQLDQSEAQC